MGAMLGTLCQACFGIILLINMLWGSALIKLTTFLGLSKSVREGWALMITQTMWRITMCFSPWVSIVGDARNAFEWEKIRAKMQEVDAEAAAGKSQHKPLMILGNHTSFLDTFVATTWGLPPGVLWRCRTYMDNALFKLPLLSTVCLGIGHFPVYFTSNQDGKFTVDKEKNAKVDEDVNKHLSSGGWLCFFPEGQINKDPDAIMDFRFGGMKKALEFDARLIFMVCHNNPKVWPRKAQVGGFPGRVRFSVRSLAMDGAKAYVDQLRSRGDLSESDKAMADHELLAKYARLSMQSQYDELRAAASGGGKTKGD
jgi:1-acyl-sn-glycerol-3-phosphate acyltransferase